MQSKPTSITAAAITKKLKPRKSALKDVVPLAASSACCLTGSFIRRRSASSVSPSCGGTRREVVRPNRFAQSLRPV